MLIEFRVKNFRCLRDEQVLSMVPTKDKTLSETNIADTGYKPIPKLLNTAVIYGANASGKSTVLMALEAMQSVVLGSASAPPGTTLDVVSFLLDPAFSSQPTEFELSFIEEGTRYQYNFSCTKEKILKETLYAYQNAKPQRWFERTHNEETNTDDYEFGVSLKGQKTVLKKATSPNALFLSVSAQLNNPQLRGLWNFFAKKLRVFIMEDFRSPKPYSLNLKDNKKRLMDIHSFLQSADIRIHNIGIKKRDTFEMPSSPVQAAQERLLLLEDASGFEAFFHHKTEKGEAVFSLENESQGTRTLFYFLGFLFDTLENKGTILFDELDNSLHRFLVEKLILLFQNEKTDSGSAQLIFTTHNTSFLKSKYLFRRDQIWFVEKDKEQASSLYSLSEFNPRKDKDIEKGYLQGSYGAIPILDEWVGGF